MGTTYEVFFLNYSSTALHLLNYSLVPNQQQNLFSSEFRSKFVSNQSGVGSEARLVNLVFRKQEISKYHFIRRPKTKFISYVSQTRKYLDFMSTTSLYSPYIKYKQVINRILIGNNNYILHCTRATEWKETDRIHTNFQVD